ncbi:bifunctional MaoC family dehydratase N-terminal/OB-fold nucleic acid binding domain-containing protein [Yinghuangia seranimata]|uniref:bifunctional MaoC family dehydratase N-terminal/OB-fold nucleic acid binding domain-containing protein n=1 Tax=Yinghuangia seranimata TaxID=408067 RepID=UPI00248C5D1A|nr:OB-fold domain-containing protein [Yinghuangia seranimata]MDI2130398.1 OB-fold domain-containing protein [Yinghuangia seranimata]
MTTVEETDAQAAKAEFLARLKEFEGLHCESGVLALDPVNGPMIRHWAEAMGDTNPVYTDAEFAKTTHFGEIVAPATMLQVWIMRGLHAGQPGGDSPVQRLYDLVVEAGFGSVVATNCEQEYMRPLRLGETVEYDQLIETVSEEKTTGLGTGHFITTLVNIFVRTGEGAEERELVGTHRFRILRYTPHKRKPKQEFKPRPRRVVNRDSKPFWDGVDEEKLLIQRCTECGTLRLPFGPGCNNCASLEWDTVEAGGLGTIYSHVTMHYPKFPAFDMPYAVALIELDEGVRTLSNIVGIPHDEVRIGMRVALEFVQHDADLKLPAFRPVDQEA